MAAAAVAAPIIAGLIANANAKKDRQAQKDAMKDAKKALQDAGMPPDLSIPLILKEFERAGVYTPELEEDLNDAVPESEMGKLTEDPSLREAQTSALAAMQKRGKVGLSAEDRAALNQVRSEVQRDSEAKRQQILQQMQSRGMGGSGAELMAQLQSSQGAADQAAAGSDTLMAQAQQRALSALSESGAMASNVRSQDLGANTARAQALDERNRFLAENSISRQTRNVGTQNQAQLANLQEQQRVNDANVAMQNAELARQSTERGTQFDRRLAQAGGQSANAMAQAQFAGQNAQRTADQYAAVGSGLATAASGYAQQQNTNQQAQLNRDSSERVAQTQYSDKNLKENIDYTDEEVQAFLDGLSKKKRK
jgi:hypothetical protein